MQSKFKQLAELAGFNMWKDEPWNPGEVVDWSCHYDDELINFGNLIVKECLAECYSKSGSDIAENAVDGVYERIQKKFGLK